jgi:hypothetical protein
MYGARTLHDIKSDLDGMPHEILEDLRQLVEDAAPALKEMVADAGTRGSAVGTTVAAHVRDRAAEAAERLPDPQTIRGALPHREQPTSKKRRVFAVLGIAAGAGGAAMVWRRMSRQQVTPYPVARDAAGSTGVPGSTPGTASSPSRSNGAAPHGDALDLSETQKK